MKNKSKTIDYEYETKTIILDKDSTRKLITVNPRQVRAKQVKSVLSALRLNKHFDSPFVVNVRANREVRILDGTHRVEALKKYFDQRPEDKVKVMMIVYRDLTDDEEREIYTKWNLSVKQSIDDFINSYKDTIPVFERLTTELPVTVYGSRTKLKFRTLVDAYLTSKEHPFTGGLSVNAPLFIKKIQEIGVDEVDYIKDTFKIMEKIFNKADYADFPRLPAFRPTSFRALFYLIRNNKVALGKNYVIKRMTTALANSVIIEQCNDYTGRSGSIQAYERFKRELNKRSTKKFE